MSGSRAAVRAEECCYYSSIDLIAHTGIDLMRRRDLMMLVGGAAVAWPLVARAQQPPKLWRVGTLSSNRRTDVAWAAFEQRMRELGYIEGQNLAIEYIGTWDRIDRVDEAALRKDRRKVDVIFVQNHITLKSMMAATSTLPIVIVATSSTPWPLVSWRASRGRAARTGDYVADLSWSKSRSECWRRFFRTGLYWVCFGMRFRPRCSGSRARSRSTAFGVSAAETRKPAIRFRGSLSQPDPAGHANGARPAQWAFQRRPAAYGSAGVAARSAHHVH